MSIAIVDDDLSILSKIKNTLMNMVKKASIIFKTITRE